MNDDIRRQFVQCLKMVAKRLLDEMTFFYASRTNVTFQEVTRRLRNDR